MTSPALTGIAPFFIVSDVTQTIAFYGAQLGFEVEFQQPGKSPFFAILRRDSVQIFIKADAAVTPLPNSRRHPYMRWDAYVTASDPDTLAAEFTNRGALFSAALADTEDGLRGFEVRDPDGYVLFFGKPR